MSYPSPSRLFCFFTTSIFTFVGSEHVAFFCHEVSIHQSHSAAFMSVSFFLSSFVFRILCSITYTPTTCMHTHLYERLRKIEPTYFEIHKVTIGASLLTGTSPATESITPINPEKYEHPCQVEDLNSGG